MSNSVSVSGSVLAAIEQNRQRLWALCYRMTGNRSDADDLAQEAVAKAMERAEQTSADDPTGWLVMLTTRLCLDHLRLARARRLTELIDPLDEPEWTIDATRASAENALVLQEDVRFAIVVALQCLSGRQRAALILRDVCGRSLAEIAETLDSNENAIKALLQRARVALAEARGRSDIDTPADRNVVERFARAVQAGSIEAIAAMLAEDVWGLVDGGGIVVTASKPTYGHRTVSRQWGNAKTKLKLPVVTEVRTINGEPAILIRLAANPTFVVALVHLETRAGQVAAQRVIRDPRRLARLCDLPSLSTSGG
jgi:RNA polymerase sigma-70 factor, ECF subfamily